MNLVVSLSVVQPSEPRIFDAQGHEVQGTAGPFLQGQEMFLSCQVTGGKPDLIGKTQDTGTDAGDKEFKIRTLNN